MAPIERKILLPEGWDAPFIELEERVNQNEAARASVFAQMNGEIEDIKKRYAAVAPPYINRSGEREALWRGIRETHPIEHPVRKAFKTYRDAANVLAHYWLGPAVEEKELLDGIMGFGNTRYNGEAYEFATALTAPGTSERKHVEDAQNFLWKDYTGR
jgi:hypothetical protein